MMKHPFDKIPTLYRYWASCKRGGGGGGREIGQYLFHLDYAYAGSEDQTYDVKR